MANLAEERLARGKVAGASESACHPGEPKLHDIMNDPITHSLMASDGIERDHLVRILGEARAKLARRRG